MRERPSAFRCAVPSCALVVLSLGAVMWPTSAGAQPAPVPATPTTVECDPEGQDFVMPPEIASSNGVLSGTINLVAEFRRLTRPQEDKPCRGDLLRVFKKNPDPTGATPAIPSGSDYVQPMPGPTLRASVGELVQLRFVNEIDPNRFDIGLDLDREACLDVGPGGQVYPVGGLVSPRGEVPRFQDTYPNCLHASSTANIHFHGTHTNPNATGDNVYLQIRPLPRNRGTLTTSPKDAMAGFEEFFRRCAEELRNPLNTWPATWRDMPSAWVDKQTELLKAYQASNPTQPLWDKNQHVLKESWPIYYIGAFPYCFALPEYTPATWPPPAGSTSPIMGQAPGTHWYHAHKHGSTAINVANGMTGAFIIEGRYDKDLNAAYGRYTLKDGQPWNARSQKVLVLNQLMGGAHPHAMTAVRTLPTPQGVDFSVNGRLRPRLTMQPGEIQLWRIVNTSGRTAAHFIPPEGLEWQQIAQDGVQYGPKQYEKGRNVNKPVYMAPANRVDLLVKAPLSPATPTVEVRIQQVMGRSRVFDDPSTVLLTVEVTGTAVTRDGQPAQMPFLTVDGGADAPKIPVLPVFLTDITDEELKQNNSVTRTFVFNSKKPVLGASPGSMAIQHTIDDIQFGHPNAQVRVLLGATEEWIVKNMATVVQGPMNSAIDHPLHIHINPFQVTEMFDPHERFVDEAGNVLERYVVGKDAPIVKGQCRLDPQDSATWRPCHDTRQGHWWDVFAIPAARALTDDSGEKVLAVFPGYFKMRSRFVDYPGLYVMHCHILIHEDRGMMFSVEVFRTRSGPVDH